MASEQAALPSSHHFVVVSFVILLYHFHYQLLKLLSTEDAYY